eukprot:CAMPEP_0197040344 /NCGR_PEP_ID=MMETSP1384-20130603/17071_1 /TAXON_ID=29189 /ORGANISM="Ammonia sp." /LENGTH=105 /DNA_ID=CAMNT_0042471085 /DNA_START=46 /DNA_END=363 /DNA_ORIENTATION=-
MLIYPYGLPSTQRNEDRPQSKWRQFLHHFTVYHVSIEQPEVKPTTPASHGEPTYPAMDLNKRLKGNNSAMPKHEPMNPEKNVGWKRCAQLIKRPPFWFHSMVSDD